MTQDNPSKQSAAADERGTRPTWAKHFRRLLCNGTCPSPVPIVFGVWPHWLCLTPDLQIFFCFLISKAAHQFAVLINPQPIFADVTDVDSTQ